MDAGRAVADISDSVLTHMHYDHIGNLDLFPTARGYLQEAELKFCTGPAIRQAAVRQPVELGNVVSVIERLFSANLQLLQGPTEILPGVTVHPVGSHTPGLEVVRVPTQRGRVVLASDAAHLWANIRLRNPFPILDNLTGVIAAYDVVEGFAAGYDHIIPGHGLLVALSFPRAAHVPAWICLHEPPIASLAAPASGEVVG